MSLEEVIREGRVMGIDFFDIFNWTWGEVQEFVLVMRERNRRNYKELAYIETVHAHLVSKLIVEGGEVDPSQEFYYWTQEERNAIRRERYKQQLLSKAVEVKDGSNGGMARIGTGEG